MQLAVKGLVLRVNETGADNRFLTVLTGERGIISVFFRGPGARKPKMGSTEALCYSQFMLFQSRERYIVNSADLLELFFPLRQDIERLSLAQYFCQLLQVVVPEEEPAAEFLRLTLNTLHFLGKPKRSPAFLKALFELRSLSLAGFMPDLVGCAGCGCFEKGRMFFSPKQGNLLCGECLEELRGEGYLSLSPSALAAMRHIIYSPLEKLFSCTASGESLNILARCAERYVLYQTARTYTALDFYNQLF